VKLKHQVVSILLGLILVQSQVFAREADQYTNRLKPLKDSLSLMDEKMNQFITKVIREWKDEDGENKFLFAQRLHDALCNSAFVSAFEDWLGSDESIDRMILDDHIYVGASFSGARFNKFDGVAPTILANGVRMGSDKPGHFVCQGFDYFDLAKIQRKGLEAAIRFGVHTEKTYYGWWVSGVYANADLVANYEGYLFFRSLSEDDIVPGKKAIITWDAGFPFIQRPFTWADHITDYWDEALLPSNLVPALEETVLPKLKEMCPDYWAKPEIWVSKSEADLHARYANIGLLPYSQNRMDYVCGDFH
jgi:hypothetical protein